MGIQGLLISSGEAMIRFVYLLAITMAIVVGNVLVIVAVGKFKKLRRTTNIMLASLAVADLLVGLITVPLYIAWTMHPEAFDKSPFLCRASLLSSLLVVASSQLNLLFLSVERYLAVCAPFKHRTLILCYPWLHTAGISLTWVVSLGTTGLASLAIKSDYVMCNYYKAFNRWFLFFAVIFGVFIPFIAIIFMNIKVFLRVLKHEKQRKNIISDYSDSVRLVSDSSDQEFRIPLLKPSTNVEDVRRSSTSKSWGICFSTSKTKRVLTRNNGTKPDNNRYNEVFFEEPNRASVITQPHFVASGQDSDSTSMRDNDSHKREVPDIYLENRVQLTHEHFPGPKCEDQNHCKNMGIENFINHYKFKGSSTCVYGIDFCTSKNKAVQMKGTKYSWKSDPNIIDFNLESQAHSHYSSSGFQSGAKDTMAGCFCFEGSCIPPLDNPILLEPLAKSIFKKCPCPFHQSQFDQKIVRGIEIFATPRFPRKLLELQTKLATQSCQATAKSASPVHLSPHPYYGDLMLLHGRDKCHVKSTTLEEKQMAKGEENVESDNKQWKTIENSSIISVSSEESVQYSRSYDSLNNDSMSKKSGIKCAVDAPFTNLSSVSSYNHCQDRFNTKDTVSASSWSSDGCLITTHVQTDQICVRRSVSQSSFFPQKSTVTENSRMPQSAVIPPIFNGTLLRQRPISTSAFYLNGKSSPRLQYVRRLSLPIFNPLKSQESQPQSIGNILRSHSPEKLPLFSVNSFQCEETQTSFPQQRRARLVSLSPEDRSCRKVSSGRSSSSSYSAYISKKVARTVALVCFSFILAWLPFFAVIIINTFCAKCNLVYFLNAVLMITFAQSASNPIIYALCHESFRNAYKNLFSQMCLKFGLVKKLCFNDIALEP